MNRVFDLWKYRKLRRQSHQQQRASQPIDNLAALPMRERAGTFSRRRDTKIKNKQVGYGCSPEEFEQHASYTEGSAVRADAHVVVNSDVEARRRDEEFVEQWMDRDREAAGLGKPLVVRSTPAGEGVLDRDVIGGRHTDYSSRTLPDAGDEPTGTHAAEATELRIVYHDRQDDPSGLATTYAPDVHETSRNALDLGRAPRNTIRDAQDAGGSADVLGIAAAVAEGQSVIRHRSLGLAPITSPGRDGTITPAELVEMVYGEGATRGHNDALLALDLVMADRWLVDENGAETCLDDGEASSTSSGAVPLQSTDDHLVYPNRGRESGSESDPRHLLAPPVLLPYSQRQHVNFAVHPGDQPPSPTPSLSASDHADLIALITGRRAADPPHHHPVSPEELENIIQQLTREFYQDRRKRAHEQKILEWQAGTFMGMGIEGDRMVRRAPACSSVRVPRLEDPPDHQEVVDFLYRRQAAMDAARLTRFNRGINGDSSASLAGQPLTTAEDHDAPADDTSFASQAQVQAQVPAPASTEAQASAHAPPLAHTPIPLTPTPTPTPNSALPYTPFPGFSPVQIRRGTGRDAMSEALTPVKLLERARRTDIRKPALSEHGHPENEEELDNGVDAEEEGVITFLAKGRPVGWRAIG